MEPPSPESNTGRWAEDQACAFLLARGLTLEARNYRCRLGEIDLIMREGRTTVFVEVRYRKNPLFGTGAETIDMKKRRRLTATAEHYLQQHPSSTACPCRFDVLSLGNRAGELHIDWIVNAFD